MPASENTIIKAAFLGADIGSLASGVWAIVEADGVLKLIIVLVVAAYILSRAYNMYETAKHKRAEAAILKEEARTKRLVNDKTEREIQQMTAFTMEHLEDVIKELSSIKKNNNGI